jgi:hypothetical protein
VITEFALSIGQATLKCRLANAWVEVPMMVVSVTVGKPTATGAWLDVSTHGKTQHVFGVRCHGVNGDYYRFALAGWMMPLFRSAFESHLATVDAAKEALANKRREAAKKGAATRAKNKKALVTGE